MSTPTFLAWSLLGAGIIALFLLLARKIAAARGAPPRTLSGAQWVVTISIPFLVGGVVTKVVCDINHLQRPAWTRVLVGAMLLIVGAGGVSQKPYGTGFWSSRSQATILMVMGAVILALEVFWP